MFTSVVFKTRD